MKKAGRTRGEAGRKLGVFVTGANGFIGSHLLVQLARRGEFSVKGLVRRTSNLARLESASRAGGFDLVFGSLEALPAGALKGLDTVVHTAARSSDWGSYDDFFRTNVEGTSRLLDACVSAGVRRFVHLSSVAVYGFHGYRNLAEESPLRPFSNNYCTSKALAEGRVLARRGSIETIVLRPSNVFGPADTSFTLPLLRSIERGLAGFPRGGRSLSSFCYVENLVRAVERAILSSGGLGEAYNVADGNDMPWREFLALTASALGKRPPRIPVPAAPLYALSLVLEGLFIALGATRPPLITPYRIAQVMRDYGFSIEKARRLLGYEPAFTTEEGIERSVRWYRGESETAAQ